MKPPAWLRPLPAAIMLLTGVWIVVLIAVVLARLTYPLELEWMEGGSLLQALRFQRGAALYPEPSAAAIPHLYTPLYAMVVGTLGLVFPLGLALGRLVSVLSMVATAVAVHRIVAYEGGPRSHRWLGVGLYLSSYTFAYRWMDVARADSMCMALVVWSLLLLRRSWGEPRRAIAAGVLMGLAFWTKQTAFIFVLGSGLAVLVVAPRQLWLYAATVGAIGLGGVAVGQLLSEGWMWTYIYELHQAHPFNTERFVRKSWLMMLHAWPFLAGAFAYVVFALLWPRLTRTRRLDPRQDDMMRARLASRRGVGFWLINAIAAMIASALGYATLWAEPNAFIPAAVCVAIAASVSLPHSGHAATVGGALCCAQLCFALAIEPRFQPLQDRGWAGFSDSYVVQDPSRTFPSSASRARAQAFRDALTRAEGPVFAYARPWWSVIASGGAQMGHAGSMGLKDVVAEDRGLIRRALAEQIKAGMFEQIWIDGEPEPWLRRAMYGRYGVGARLHGDDRVLPMTGWMSPAGTLRAYTSDQLMFTPIRARPVEAGETVIVDFEGGSLAGTRTGGTAFGDRPVQSLYGKHPPIGPIDGGLALSSAASSLGRRARGTARTPTFTIPSNAVEISALLGTSGRADGLFARLEISGGKTIDLPLPMTPWRMERVRLKVPPEWRGKEASLVVSDDSTRDAIFFDDVRVRVGP